MGCQSSTSRIKKATKGQAKGKAVRDSEEDSSCEIQGTPDYTVAIKKEAADIIKEEVVDAIKEEVADAVKEGAANAIKDGAVSAVKDGAINAVKSEANKMVVGKAKKGAGCLISKLF
ncbi:unnamed protein product [Moneuplotes crassus]|uniref:Uncharacterized protein n=1 Tax=Euplotes crassus TaxID=5936 RepID=A0AAD2D0F6_EUPCR|nr:unnamed protein product [Moneuplotes crassus]